MVLPTLTWNLVGPVAIVSGVAQPGASGNASKQYLMYTLQRLIQSSSYWLVDVQDVTGSATEALVLKPNPDYSSTQNMRIVATMNVSGALGGATTTQIMQDRTAGAADTATTNAFLMGFTPDVTPNNVWITGSWNSDRPWGPNVRWSKYYTGFLNGTNSADQMYLIESQETLWVGFKGRRGNTNHYGIGCGAFIQSCDSGSGEQVTGSTGRVYGMTATAAFMGTAFLGNTAQGPFGCGSTANTTFTGVFPVSGGVPNAPTATGAANTNTWELCSRQYTLSPAAASDTAADRGQNTTSAESLIGWPIPIVSFAPPVRIIGFLRQIYVNQDMPGLLQICSGVNATTTVGITLGADTLSTCDNIIFLNRQ